MGVFTDSVWLGCFLQVAQQFHDEVRQVFILTLDYLLGDGIHDQLPLDRVVDKEETLLPLEVNLDIVEVTLEDNLELGCEDLVLFLLGCQLHHGDELRGWLFIDVKDQ